MELAYGEMTTIAAIVAAAALMMIPVLGLTLRHTLPPILEAVAKARATRSEAAGRGDRFDRATIAESARVPVGAGARVAAAGELGVHTVKG